MRLLGVLGVAVALAPTVGAAQVAAPTREVRFTTEEGSWLSFDVSRDGRWIIFDLLGQLWRVPARGGTAVPLTNAVRDAEELLDPTFSPDGRSILVHGESRGRLGVFRLDPVHRELQFVMADALDGNQIPVQSPAWSPSGLHVLHARREGRVTALVERELATGVERRLVITGVPSAMRDGAIYSADGEEILFHTHDAGSGYLRQAGRLWRVPRAGGAATPVTVAGTLVRAPAPAPDGRRVAYFLLDSTSRAQLWIQRLDDSVGVAVAVGERISPTRVRWVGSNAVLFVDGGRLWRLDLRTRRRSAVPFQATVAFARSVPDLPPVDFPEVGERRAVRAYAGTTVAPDGRTIAIVALDQLWLVATDAPTVEARAITAVPSTAASPAWSPDGRSIAWSAGGFLDEDIFITDTLTRLTRRATAFAGGERTPTWSADGTRLYIGHGVEDSAGRRFTLRSVSVRDTAVRDLAETIDFGRFSGFPVAAPRGGLLLNLGASADAPERPATMHGPDGAVRGSVHGLVADLTQPWWLPGDTLLYVAASRLWRAPFEVATGRVGPATPVGDGLATSVRAAPSGHVLLGGEAGLELRRGFEAPRHLGWPVSYEVPTPRSLLIRNVRLIDGSGAPVTDPRDVLLERGRITRIGPPGSLGPMPGLEVLDAEGRVAIPGLIDLHAHQFTPAQFRGVLHYGVTTARLMGVDQTGQGDAVLAGARLGPRTTSGIRVFADWPLSSTTSLGFSRLADSAHFARAMRTLPAQGHSLLKLYSPRAWSTQVRMIEASHALGVRTTGHCGYPLALIAAGANSKEHVGWQCSVRDRGEWYDDLIQLYARSGMPVVPTLALFTMWARVGAGATPPPQDVAALYSAVEHAQLSGAYGRGTLTVANHVTVRDLVVMTQQLHSAGVLLGTGTDTELPDGIHYELEALVGAGLTPLEALRAATSVSAQILGASRDVGTIAPGYRADLVLLDADPSVDIRNTRRIWKVVQGGHVIPRTFEAPR